MLWQVNLHLSSCIEDLSVKLSWQGAGVKEPSLYFFVHTSWGFMEA